MGTGDVGEIDLPSDSTLSLMDRGYLGNIVGPDTTDVLSGAKAGSLSFADLLGSITGLDSIQSLQATGWLGTSGEQVAVWQGIGSLSAYGIGATVQTDMDQYAADPALTLNVGRAGSPRRSPPGRWRARKSRGMPRCSPLSS